MRRAVLAMVAAVLLAACGGRGSAAPNTVQRNAGVYTAVLSAVAAQQTTTTTGQLPVVYAIPSGREAIAAQVQTEVVKAVKSTMTLRFADERGEAIDDNHEGQPVRDNGTLVTLPPVPAEGSRLDLRVDVYRTAADQQSLTVTVTEGPQGWAVTSVVPAA